MTSWLRKEKKERTHLWLIIEIEGTTNKKKKTQRTINQRETIKEAERFLKVNTLAPPLYYAEQRNAGEV